MLVILILSGCWFLGMIATILWSWLDDGEPKDVMFIMMCVIVWPLIFEDLVSEKYKKFKTYLKARYSAANMDDVLERILSYRVLPARPKYMLKKLKE